MVTASNGQVGQVDLPELPPADAKRRDAPRRAEIVTPAPAEGAADTPHGDSLSSARLRVLTWLSARTLTGDSLLRTQPPSLAQVWARHRECAGHYNGWLMQWFRWSWALLHMPIVATTYLLAWVFTSPPLFLTAAGVAAAVWFFH